MDLIVKIGKNKWKVRNPIAKVVIGGPLIAFGFGMAMLLAGMAMGMAISGVVFGVAIIVIGAPLWVPLHFVLKALGRRGFVTTHNPPPAN